MNRRPIWLTFSPANNPNRPYSPQHIWFAAFLLLAGLALVAAPRLSAQNGSWCASSGQSDIPEAECQALEDLFLSTNGQTGWVDKSGWLASTAVCTEWFGVTCDSGHVSSVALVSNNLEGPLPASLSNLSLLNELTLSGNLLSGPLPASLGSISTLETLLLGDNDLDGSIPVELGNLSELTTLDLGKNQLEGSIPSELGQLSNLTIWLFLEGNQLEGPIPAEICSLTPLLATVDHNKLEPPTSAPEACDTLFPDWQLTQTVPPTNLSADLITVNSAQDATEITAEVVVSWLPIAYTGDGGNYEVFTRQLSSSTITSRGMTADKTAASLQVTVTGNPENFAYFVRTNTPAHGENQNDLISKDSEEVEIIPNAIRMQEFRAGTPLLYFPALAPLILLLLTVVAVAAFRKR